MSPASLHPRPIILLLEDQQRTRDWLIDILRRAFPEAEVRAEAKLADAFAVLSQLEEQRERARLSMALIDINLPDGSGIELVRELAVRWPDACPVVATIYDDDLHLMQALGAGAKGYLLKGEEADLLVGYLHRIRAGEPPMSPSIAHRILAHFRDTSQQGQLAPSLPHQTALSPRETEVLGLIGRGLSVSEAARRMELSTQTVAGYVKAVYSKLSVSNRAQAALEARRRGLA